MLALIGKSFSEITYLEILKDPTGMLMDLPLGAIAKKSKGDQIGYDFTTLEDDEPFIYFKRKD